MCTSEKGRGEGRSGERKKCRKKRGKKGEENKQTRSIK
jgi:hypothetical protein